MTLGAELIVAKIALKIGCALWAPTPFVQESANELIDQLIEFYNGRVGSLEQQIQDVIEDEISLDALKQRRIPESKCDYIQSETKQLLANISITPKRIACCKGDMNLLSNELVAYYQAECVHYPVEDSQYIICVLNSLLPKLVKLLPQNPGYIFQGLLELYDISDDLRQHIKELESQIMQTKHSQHPVFLSDRPFDLSEHFLGREQIVQDAVQRIMNGKSITLCGIGGIGKTEIAKAVIKDIEKQNCDIHKIEKIAWVEYDNQNIFFCIAKSFRETRKIENLEQAWDIAYSIIQELRDSLLLVIDNVESISQDENLFRLADLPCRILITSREEKISSIESVLVEPLSNEKCEELFRQYYHKCPMPTYLVEKIVHLAGRHTVTIELLSKIAQVEDLSLSEFYDKLVTMGFDLSEEKVSSLHERLQREEKIIEQLAILFSVHRLNDAEIQLLVPVSAIPAIPFQFAQARTWFNQRDRSNLNRLVRSGWLYAFVTSQNTQYVIHSVIASAIRYQYKEELYGRCRGLIASLTQQMQYGEDEHGSEKVELIQFSWSVNDLLSNHLQDELDGDFLFNLSRIYKDVGNYQQSVYLLQRSIHLYRDQRKFLKCSAAYNLLGLVYQDQCKPTCALTQYQKALRLMNAVNIEEECYVSLFSNMGLAYMALEGNYPSGNAHFYLCRAFDMAVQHYGNEDQRTLEIRFNLANCIAPKDARAATKIFQEVIAAVEKNPHAGLLQLGKKHQAFGNYLFDIGEFCDASSELEKALTIFSEKLGERHPETADVKNTLALIYRQFDNKKALQYFREYLENARDIYGESSPVTATAYNNLGCCFFDMGTYEQALAEFELAEKTLITMDVYNPEDMGQFLSNQAQCHSSLQNFPNAIRLLKRALLEYERDPKVCADGIARCYGVMGDVYRSIDNKTAAYECFDCAIVRLKSIWGEEHLSVASIYNNYALLLEDDERFQEALDLLEGAKRILLYSYQEVTPQLESVEENIERIQQLIERDKEKSINEQDCRNAQNQAIRPANCPTTGE